MAIQYTDDKPVSENETRQRFAEIGKFVPVVFVVMLIMLLWSIFTLCHLIPMLQLDHTAEYMDNKLRRRGIIDIIVFNCLTVMVLICYSLSVLVHPGEVPDNDKQWEFVPNRGIQEHGFNLQESKRDGHRRYCKWCGKYKPDRCHHCRICRMCILKMDHHCPWIYNCVGFKNYKHFFLLLIYAGLTLHFIFWSMLTTLQQAILVDTPFVKMFLVMFGEFLSFLLMCLVTTFWSFHLWMVSKAMTTIEFCEKSAVKSNADGTKHRSYDATVYDLGFVGNIKAILGHNVFLWLLPVSNTPGDGLAFICDETRLTKDLGETTRLRVKGHRRTQRSRSRSHSPSSPAYGSTCASGSRI